MKKQTWAWLLRPKDGKEDGVEKEPNPNEPSTSKQVEKVSAPEETVKIFFIYFCPLL